MSSRRHNRGQANPGDANVAPVGKAWQKAGVAMTPPDRYAKGVGAHAVFLGVPKGRNRSKASVRRACWRLLGYLSFTARSGSASGDALNQRALGGKLPLSFSLHGRHQCLPTSDARCARKGARFRPRPTTSSSIAASPRRSLRSRAAPRPRSTKRKRPALAEDPRRKGARGPKASSIGAPLRLTLLSEPPCVAPPGAADFRRGGIDR